MGVIRTDGTRFRLGLGALMVAAMASATALLSSVGVVATFIIDDLGISRGMLGGLIAANAVVAAAVSPRVGWIVDSLGGKRSLLVVFGASAVGFLGVAISPVYLVMVIPVMVTSIGQAATNPATNKLISELAPSGRRGLLTGIKQSGVQMGIFVIGVSLPSLAAAVGWRWAFAVVAIFPLAAIPIAGWFIPTDTRVARVGSRPSDGAALPPAITVLAVYGALLGFGASYTYLVPLYAEESLGFSPAIGGLAAGLTGLAAVVGRIAWASWSEHHGRFFASLRTIAAIGVLAALAYGTAAWVAAPLLWVGVVLTGLSSSSWNSVANLAVMAEAGTDRAGRASGVLMLGFLAGLGVGPPLYGWSVDLTGSYTTMWVVSAVALTGGFVVAAAGMRRAAVPSAP